MKPRWARHFSLEAEAQRHPNYPVDFIEFNLGAEDDSVAPRIVWQRQKAGMVLPPHTHGCDYVEFILEGTQRVGRRWFRKGDVRLVAAGTGYGPLESGPEGCTVLVVFANQRWRPIRKGRSATRPEPRQQPHAECGQRSATAM